LAGAHRSERSLRGHSPVPLAYHIDPADRLVTITGEFGTADDWKTLLTRILHDPLLHPGFKFLRDRRGAAADVDVDTVVAVVDAIRRFWPHIQPSRAAILISRDCDPRAIAASELADGHGLSIKAFTSYAAAVTWLDEGVDGKPYSSDQSPALEITPRVERSTDMRTVLVVDDDADCRTMLEHTLTFEGFRVVCACNGREALVLAHKQRPGVILLDLMMPVMSGYEFRLNQQNDPSLADIPIVCISGTYNAEARARDIEAVACFTKPLQLDALVGTIRAMLASQ
jgi:CheY-like chemotaxis protein